MGMLEGKVALVTGCARMHGLGRSIARALAEAGADVAVTDIGATGVRNALEKGAAEAAGGWQGLPDVAKGIEALGRRALALLGDVGEERDAERMVRDTVASLGRIDILVNNAGAPHGADRNSSWEVPAAAFDAVMRINARGTFLMSTAVTRHLLAREGGGRGGRIINMSSSSGQQGLPRRAAYCASKFAIIGLTQAMALELAAHGITVNAICPGPVDTSRNESTRARAAAGQDAGLDVNATPVGRIGQPMDVARAVLFLADPAADFVTGQAIGVNGGTHMR
ncbi:MAG: SDR family oxidoreductase [Betaproteobacteria bacterium]|nr:SDR family oxidoreductase [Betaproteobacteria bacterium]